MEIKIHNGKWYISDQKFPTPASKWFQCIREELVFWEELVRTAIQYSRAKINKEKLELKIERDGKEFFIEF